MLTVDSMVAIAEYSCTKKTVVSDQRPVIVKVPKNLADSHFHGSRVPPRNDRLYEIPPGPPLPKGVWGDFHISPSLLACQLPRFRIIPVAEEGSVILRPLSILLVKKLDVII